MLLVKLTSLWPSIWMEVMMLLHVLDEYFIKANEGVEAKPLEQPLAVSSDHS